MSVTQTVAAQKNGTRSTTNGTAPQPKLDYSQPVDVMEQFDRTRFEAEYLKPMKPVVLRGLFKGTKAHEKWDFDYFKAVAGEKEVGVYENRVSDLDKTLKEPHHRMKFADYLDLIAETPTDLRIHLWNIFHECPELLDDFTPPDIGVNFMKTFPFMFFGGKGSVARMHQDIDLSHVYLTQFTGKRRVILFSPDYSTLLYRYPLNVHTGVDVIEPDYDRHPGLAHVKGHSCVIEHGDTLYMPGGWWHYIEYLEGGFGMSLRSRPTTIPMLTEAVLNIFVNQHLDRMLRSVLGKRWFEMKQKIAQLRANRAIGQRKR